jgi:uncharacterized protein (DUF433 family)
MTTSENLSSKQHEMIVSDPEMLDGMPVIKGTRFPVYDLAASIQAGIPRVRILAAYPTITEYHLDLAIPYAEANPLQQRNRRLLLWPGATLVTSGQVLRRKG